MGSHFKTKLSATGSIVAVMVGLLGAMLGGLHPFLAVAHAQPMPVTAATSPATQPAAATSEGTLGPGTLVPVGIVVSGLLLATTAAYKVGGMIAKMKRDNRLEIRAINRLNTKVFGDEAAKLFELEEDP